MQRSDLRRRPLLVPASSALRLARPEQPRLTLAPLEVASGLDPAEGNDGDLARESGQSKVWQEVLAIREIGAEVRVERIG